MEYHEVLQPVREIKESVVNWLANLAVPSSAMNNLIQTESSKRTVEMFAQDQLFED